MLFVNFETSVFFQQDEENEALDQALRTFEDEFGGVIPPPSSKAFIRGDVVENNRTSDPFICVPYLTGKPQLVEQAGSYINLNRKYL